MIRRLSREFLEFVQRGNVVDLAVAVIIGAAFTKIVNAVVELITTEALKPSMQELGISHLDQWPAGLVIAALINFIVVAVILFVVIKLFEPFKRQSMPAEPVDPQQRLTDSLDRLCELLEQRLI